MSSEAESSNGGEDKKVCPASDCAYAADCEVIRITGKIPKQGKKCSYFEKPRQGKKKSSGSDSGNEL